MQYHGASYAANAWDIYWFEKNLQGDVVAVYNIAGTKLISYRYDAWGKYQITYSNSGASSSAVLNPFRYRGYYYDVDLNLYYLQSRYYDPVLCRFISVDSYVSTGTGILGYNMYAYCNNNPVMYEDGNGNIPFNDHTYTDAVSSIADYLGNLLKDWLHEDREKAKSMEYTVTETSVEIEDSYQITNLLVMYEYINEHIGDELSGSTTGAVFEWKAHNIAYNLLTELQGKGVSGLNDYIKSAQSVNIGSTIYKDNHGLMSVFMWEGYIVYSPVFSIVDALIEIFE